MSKKRLIKIACGAIGSIVAVTLLLRALSPSSDGYRSRKTTIHDPALTVTGFTATEGTNHTTYKGSRLFGVVNRALMQMGLGCVGDARQLTLTTTQDSSLLWIAYRHPTASLGRGGIVAFLTHGRGEMLPVEATRSMSDPKNNSYLTVWILPARLTNYAGWGFHLVTKPDGKKLVSFEL